MRRPAVFAIRIGYVLLIALVVLLVYPAFKRAKSKSGPTPRSIIRNHLEKIDEAKEILKEDQKRPDGYWPSRAEIAWAFTETTNASFDALVKPTRLGEIYIINQIGAPAYAYFSNAVADIPEGALLTEHDLDYRPPVTTATNSSPPIPTETNSTSSPAGSNH